VVELVLATPKDLLTQALRKPSIFLPLKTHSNFIMTSNREWAISIVKAFMAGGFESEEKDTEMLAELHQRLPDPEFERFLFWGPDGPDDPVYEAFTAEDIVDKAMAYRSINLQKKCS
jgi:hypothetical protein